ncbi:hypothetical protein J4408_00715 [Candidatus Pacearchaeota archaeon]|nr:hypothetical protein [Candidatus Pacearchaeota archaeon]
MELKQAIAELRKLEKKKFDQSVDLIVNLKGIDLRKESINVVASIPHKIKDKKVAAFLTKRNDIIHTITEPDFAKFKDKKVLKNLVKSYDFFISVASLMPKVASTFGKVLGPTGKMPSPQLGIVVKEDADAIKAALLKIERSVKVRAKEPSIKVVIAKESMSDEQITENILAVYNAVVNSLPTKKDNIRSAMIKLTMSKPIKVEIK